MINGKHTFIVIETFYFRKSRYLFKKKIYDFNQLKYRVSLSTKDFFIDYIYIQSMKTDETATTDLFYSSILVATYKNSWREQILAAAHNYITAVLSFNVGSSEPAMVNDPSQRWENINVEST